MTNDLERTFFNTFGIEPKFKGYSNTEELSTGGVIPCGNIKYFNTIEEMDKANYWCFNMWELDEEDKDYPQISDRMLLELICFIEQIDLGRYGEYEYFCKFNYEDLRTEILAKSIRLAHKKAHSEVNGQLFYNQVRTLFEKG